MDGDSYDQHSPREEVTKVDEFTVCFVFHVHDTPAVLASSHRLAVNEDAALRAHDSEGNHVLWHR